MIWTWNEIKYRFIQFTRVDNSNSQFSLTSQCLKFSILLIKIILMLLDILFLFFFFFCSFFSDTLLCCSSYELEKRKREKERVWEMYICWRCVWLSLTQHGCSLSWVCFVCNIYPLYGCITIHFNFHFPLKETHVYIPTATCGQPT